MSRTVAIDDCWNRIGIWSRQETRCERLEQVVHCRNCSVYMRAGRQLLDRAAPDEYLAEWRKVLAAPARATAGDLRSVVTFRLGSYWFALATTCCAQVADAVPVHSVPHNRNALVAGLVNIDGQLLACVSLAALLGLDSSVQTSRVAMNQSFRMLVVSRGSTRLVCQVQATGRVQRIDVTEVANPATRSAVPVAEEFCAGIFEVDGKSVWLLEGEAVMDGLQKGML